MKTKAIIVIVCIAIILIFSIQNIALTEVKFLFWKFSMSRVLIILGSFGIGVLVGLLISMKNRK